MLRALVAGAAVLAALVTAVPARAGQMKEINFGIISTDSTVFLRERFTPFLDDMAKGLEMKVNAFFAPDYAGIIEGMRFDKVQVAWFGNKSAMEAVDRSNGEIFVQTMDVNGNPGYWSMIITHRDGPIKTLDDLLRDGKRYTFGNGDPNSTSGYLVPGYYVFAVNKIDPKTHFKRTLNANHETNALAVINRQVDAATNNTESMDRIKERWPARYEQVRVLWKSPLIPSDPIVWRKDLPDDVKAKVKRFFLGYGTGIVRDAAAEKAVLAGLQWSGFRASDDSQLVPIRQLALYQERIKVQGDATLGADAKQRRLAEIDAQLAALAKRSGAK